MSRSFYSLGAARDSYDATGALAELTAVRKPCPACDSVPGVPYVHIHGSMCWQCGLTPDGYRPTGKAREYHRASLIKGIAALVKAARAHERAGLAASWLAKHGPEIDATIHRAPDEHEDDVRQRARDALSAAMPEMRPFLG